MLINQKFFFLCAQYLPVHHLLSRVVGWLAASKVYAIRHYLIKWFIKRYAVDMTEAAQPDWTQYESFNAFFTRSLRPSARHFSANNTDIISPADGVISAAGELRNGQIIQAKSRTYALSQLLGSEDTQAFAHFVTIYLSPRDYHRVHMPMDGTLTTMRYIPGRLFSVGPTTVRHIPNLFARNERLVCTFDTKYGTIACVLIGAMIVAGIATSWAGPITPIGGRVLTWQYNAMALAKGDELGRFYLGSTVVLLLPASMALRNECKTSASVRMGQTIACC